MILWKKGVLYNVIWCKLIPDIDAVVANAILDTHRSECWFIVTDGDRLMSSSFVGKTICVVQSEIG